MAATRIYGGSNLSLLIQNDAVNCSSQPLDSFFISGSSPSFLGSRSMVSFEDVHCGKRTDRSLFRSFDQDENCGDEYEDYFHQPEKKRRLTSNQVQFLERSFELENKLEPERKIQLAKDLGLQPRQVAIWFQNRRARWKTKQLEKDYETLQASYDSLKTGYESLLREKDRLKTEVLHLTEKMRLKENVIANCELSTSKPIESPQQEPISDSASEEEISKLFPNTARKHEDLSSVKSDELDSGSPHFADDGHSSFLDPNDSSNLFEHDQSDLSQDEEDNVHHNLLHPCIFPKLEDGDYDSHQSFWSWSF